MWLSTRPTYLLPTTCLSTPRCMHTTHSFIQALGFTIQRDDPTAIEQVRAMLSAKQKQKALVESQRGSVSSVGITDGRRG